MRVITAVVGVHPGSLPSPPWPADWPVPSIGDAVHLPGIDGPLRVRVIEWFPLGEDDDPTPAVTVVIGPPAPSS